MREHARSGAGQRSRTTAIGSPVGRMTAPPAADSIRGRSREHGSARPRRAQRGTTPAKSISASRGGLRSASTVVIGYDRVGRIAVGGEIDKTEGGISVIPRDGVRQRLHVLLDGRRVQLTVEKDGFAPDVLIAIDDAGTRIAFTLENRVGQPHRTILAGARRQRHRAGRGGSGDDHARRRRRDERRIADRRSGDLSDHHSA